MRPQQATRPSVAAPFPGAPLRQLPTQPAASAGWQPPPLPAIPSSTLGFALFIVVNVILFIRPSELIPDLRELPLYEMAILSCLAASFPGVLALFATGSFYRQPISICVFGMLSAIVLSHLSHFNLYDARVSGTEFAKVLVYYVLFVCHINSLARLRQYVFCLVIFVAILTTVALVHFHGIVDIPALEAVQQRDIDDETGDEIAIPRLVSTGIYNDPNDFCMILTTSILVCLYFSGNRASGVFRPLWLIPIAIFVYALTLTRSRGGLLGLGAGAAVFSYCRFGLKKSLLYSLLALPLIGAVFAGRQMRINVLDRNDTGFGRVILWSEGMMLFQESPLFGIGHNMYAEAASQVAHNSFVHSFTELGLYGGTVFVGAFYCALWPLARLRKDAAASTSDEFVRLQPYMIAIVTAYVAGMYSLSRAYVVPTYMILGLACAYLFIAERRAPLSTPSFNSRVLIRIGVAGVAVFIFLQLLIRLLLRVSS